MRTGIELREAITGSGRGRARVSASYLVYGVWKVWSKVLARYTSGR